MWARDGSSRTRLRGTLPNSGPTTRATSSLYAQQEHGSGPNLPQSGARLAPHAISDRASAALCSPGARTGSFAVHERARTLRVESRPRTLPVERWWARRGSNPHAACAAPAPKAGASAIPPLAPGLSLLGRSISAVGLAGDRPVVGRLHLAPGRHTKVFLKSRRPSPVIMLTADTNS